MNVAELIEQLKKYPQDTDVVVLYQACSNYCLLEENDIKFVPLDKLKEHYENTLFGSFHKQYVKRNGQIIEYDKKTWPKDEVPHFVSLLIFPGN